MTRKQSIPEELTDASRGIRLQKAMAEAGVASRRDCEALIEEGRVTVNGRRVSALPAWVDPENDRVEVDGQPIQKRGKKSQTTGAHRLVYFMVNKPKRVISTAADEQGRATVLDLIDSNIKQRLFPVGRLDADSTGLMLLTNDGELANRLTHPRYGVTKQYHVTIRGRLEEKDLARLRKGLFLAHAPGSSKGTSGGASKGTSGGTSKGTSGGTSGDVKLKKASMESVRILRHDTDRARGDHTLLHITLREGQNREIRRMLARLGFNVRKLDRVGIASLRLKGVPRGGWRPLTTLEVGKLKKAAGVGRGT